MNQNRGHITWIDLTVKEADKVKDFYSKVAGWKSEAVSMGEYNDYSMYPKDGDEPVSGICHARGVNKGLPPQWLIYISVENLDDSLALCRNNGGEVLSGPKNLSENSRHAIIKDPAGAVAALYEDR